MGAHSPPPKRREKAGIYHCSVLVRRQGGTALVKSAVFSPRCFLSTVWAVSVNQASVVRVVPSRWVRAAHCVSACRKIAPDRGPHWPVP